MDGVVVKRYRRDGGDNKKYYLCLLSLQDFSLSEICNLSFFRDGAQIKGSRCDDWMCFNDCRGKYVVCNLTTKEVKLLPPHKLDNPSNRTRENGSGIGYDYKSGGYKVVRNFTEYYPDGDLIDHAELYSLKSDSFKVIPTANPYVCPSGGGVYVGGSYYWVASLGGEIVRGVRGSAFGFYVLRFDFANEAYSAIPLPPDKHNKDPLHYLVECGGFLGIIIFPKIKHSDFYARPRDSKSYESSEVSKSCKKSRSSRRRCFQLWVWKDMSWTKLYDAALHHVVKPLCLIDGRISFFQGKSHRKQCDLVMYDWSTKEMKKFDICDYPGHMQIFPCVDSGVQLPPDAKSINGPYTEETKKTKIKTKAKAVLQACVHQNASSVRDEAKPIDTMGEGKTHHFKAPGESKFDRGLEGVNLEEIPAKRRRKKAYKEEDISDGDLHKGLEE